MVVWVYKICSRKRENASSSSGESPCRERKASRRDQRNCASGGKMAKTVRVFYRTGLSQGSLEDIGRSSRPKNAGGESARKVSMLCIRQLPKRGGGLKTRKLQSRVAGSAENPASLGKAKPWVGGACGSSTSFVLENQDGSGERL